MFHFIRNMWVMRRVSEELVRSFVGEYGLTQEQIDEILSTAQNKLTEEK